MIQKLYYIQTGFIGNAILWWAVDSHGYTADFTKAGKYTRKEVDAIIKRPQDIAWLCSHIDKNEKAKILTIDRQYLNSKYCLKGKRK